MDYYSGTPAPDDYNFNNGNGYGDSGDGSNNFFKNNTVLILICLAIAIVILIVIFLFTGKGSPRNYNILDRDSTLSELEVFGGELDPSFSPEIIKYDIIATSPDISFDCKASSDKAKVEGCSNSVSVEDEEVSYNIKVTAEDGNITRYYFKIVKSEDFVE